MAVNDIDWGKMIDPDRISVDLENVSDDVKLLYIAMLQQNSYLKEIRDMLKNNERYPLHVSVEGVIDTYN